MVKSHFSLLMVVAVVLCTLLNAVFGIEEKTGRSTGNTAPASVRDFGAAGDGMRDDTEAIQKAVNSGIGHIHFPKGIYRLTKPVVIELNKTGHIALTGSGVAQIVMAGPGPAFHFMGTHLKSADPPGFASEVWDKQRMPMVDGLALLGEHPNSEGIVAVGTMQLTITKVHARKLLHVVHLTGNNRNLLISDCHFYENRGCGVFYDQVNLHQSNITASHISYNHGGGIVSRGGNVRNIHITGCDIESNMGRDVPATANVLIDCTDSEYGTGEVAITGCTIQHNNPSPDSANIRILGRSKPSKSQQLVREGNVTITGNVLSDVQVNIHLRDCRGITITGNTLWQGYRHNLLIEDSTAVVVGANNLDRNPRYDYGNTQEATNSVLFRNCNDCIVDGLLVTNIWRDAVAVTLENCRRCSFSDCSILDCDNIGLLLKDSELCRVSNCLIRDDRKAGKSKSLVVRGGRNNLISGNVLGTTAELDADSVIARDNDVDGKNE